MKISLAFTTAALHLANDSQQPASNQSRYFQQSLKKVTHNSKQEGEEETMKTGTICSHTLGKRRKSPQ